MSLSPSDRALRRLVAQVAAATRDDVEAILGLLEPSERGQVESLLATYLGVSQNPPVAAPGEDIVELALGSGLSPWLAMRLDPEGLYSADSAIEKYRTRGGPLRPELSSDVRMTSTAVEALQSCVVAVRSNAPQRPAVRPSESTWMRRLRRSIVQARAAE